ncbi:MAG: glycosyltransferase family 9 protein [Phycisphaerales bacterium JB039]
MDRWIGVPLCAGLTAVRRLGDLAGRGAARPVRRILFVKLAEQGSTVLAVSAIRAAIARVGRENVYFAVFEENRFILDLMELIPQENVISIRVGGVGATMLRTLGAIRRMRRLGIDAAIDLEFFARSSAAISYLSGAQARIGFHPYKGEGPYRGDLMTHRLRFNPHMHSSQTFRSMVDAIDVDPDQLPAAPVVVNPVDEQPPPFRPTAEELGKVRGLLERHGAEDGPLVLLNANCSDLIPLRAWPRERYVELAGMLLESNPHARIAMTGAPAERDGALKLVEQIGSDRCFNLAGETTLRELLVLYTLADVLVTNDSGPAHFATLTPIDVITLFGPEHPALFGARSPRNHVVWAGLVCSPCVSALNNRESSCRNNLCMQSIQASTVHQLLLRVLRDRSRGDREAAEEVTLELVIAPAALGAPSRAGT